MTKSNPSARGYASAYNSSITNQFTAGGSKKSGLGTHIGMGPFVYAAIVNGASGHAASLVSGLNWRQVNNGKQYPVSTVNQLAGGVGRPRWGMFNPSADGTNANRLNYMQARVNAGPKKWMP
jgi:hypothetical protein